jgi:hypothetical protein
VSAVAGGGVYLVFGKLEKLINVMAIVVTITAGSGWVREKRPVPLSMQLPTLLNGEKMIIR